MGSPYGATRLGTRFGPYDLRELIGMGGMGEVYRAYDTVRERMVAIKLLRADMAVDSSFQQRFRRESRMAARLQNPHVIPVHDFGEIDGVLFIDMRLVEGPSVKEELRVNGALPPARTVSIVAQVAAALDAAHGNGLVHRDIKPENVLLTADDFAYLVDFGIAHGGGEASVTSTGLVIGSCAYMAPERINGGRGGPASDVYSLTCLLYEALTGRAPFASGDLRAIMGAHLFTPPPRPSATRTDLSPAFDDVVARGMAKDPADRYRSAGELARAASAATAAASRTSTPHPVAIPSPPQTRQFSSTDPNPAASGPGPRVPLPAPPVSTPRTTSRTAPILVIVIAVMFAVAALLAAVLVSGDDSSDPESPTRLAGPTPTTSAAPSTSDETTSADPTTTTSTAPSTTGASAVAGVSGTDAQGFVGHSARCDAGSSPAAAIRTANSLAVVCETSSGNFYYRGERLRDGASLELSDVRRSGDGFEATNPADGARYQVQPDMLTILSGRGVDSAEPALEWGSD